MNPKSHRLFSTLLLMEGAVLAVAAALVAQPALAAGRLEASATAALAALAGGALILWVGHVLQRRHFDDLMLLDVALRQVARGEVPPEQLLTRGQGREPDEIGHLARMISDMATHRAAERTRPDQRLASVIAALGDAVVVITETGQVSLVNSAARALLGAQRVAVGTSVFAALDRDSLVAAIALAKTADRRPVAVSIRTVEDVALGGSATDFGEHRGAVLTFAAREVEHFYEVEHALDLHDLPPAAAVPVPDTRLDQLPGIVFDTETTGLDVDRDTIVSIGAVRTHGARIFRGVTIDCLVNPGRAIPAASTAVHGITNAMVADAPPPSEALPPSFAMMRNTVVIGHNTGFDLAMLRNAARQAGLPWHEPPWLDVILLGGALDPKETDLNLESMAQRLGINVSGRHTALGDALVTAEIFARLLPLLGQRGIVTFGDAVEFSQTARHVVAQQRAAGW